MSLNIEHSVNVGHRQLLRCVGGFPQANQFSQECAKSYATVRTLHELRDLHGHEGCVNVIVFSPSGDVLASGSDDGKVRLWNPYTFKCLRTMTAHQSNVFAAEFLPFSEQQLASGGNDAELKYYNLETEEGTVYSHHTRKVLRMTVHPEHAHSFMTCSADGTVRMIDTRQHYDASSSGPIETVQGRQGDVVPQALGGGRGGRAERGTGTPVAASLVLNYRTRTSSPQLYCVDFNPMNGQQFIVSTDMGDVRLFDLRQIRDHSPCSCVNIYTHKIGNLDDITGCAFSKDGRTIVTTALSDSIYTFDVDANYEKENNFPLCIKGAASRREPCDHSGHTYTPEMISRYHTWSDQQNRGSGSHGMSGLGFVRNANEEEEDGELDEEGEEEEEEAEEGGADMFGEEAEEETSAQSERMHVDESSHTESSAEEHSHDQADGAEEAERAPPQGAAQRPNIRDLLGALPILTGEGGAMTIDLETFLRVAAGVVRERRPRRRRAPRSAEQAEPTSTLATAAVAEPTPESAPSVTTAPSDTSTTSSSSAPTQEPRTTEEASSAPEQSSAPARPERSFRSSPYGPHGSSPPSPSKDSDSKKPASPAVVDLHLPDTFKKRFTGHASVQTIKGVGFWGPNSEFVVSGSDDSSFFIWDTETAKLLNILQGHDDVVNCVVGHPRIPIVASSGIDDIIKLWEPSGPMPSEAEMEQKISSATRANTANRRFGRAIQCAQQ